MRAVALLSWWQLKNSIRTLFTDPKKLIPFLFFALIVGLNGWMLLMAPHARRRADSGIAGLVTQDPVESHAVVFATLMLFALYSLWEGFVGKALAFSLADVDYLFPSPIPRRVVLAFKIPGLMLSRSLWALGIVYFVWTYLWRGLPDGGPGTGEVVLLYLGGALWLAFYTNLAAAAEVAFGLGKAAFASRVFQGVLVLLLAWAAVTVRLQGFAGLTALDHNPVFVVLFYPCRLLADVMLRPISGGGIGGAVAQLAILCAASLAVALTRRENFYEATLDHSERVAHIRQAAREGNAFAAWAIRTQRGRKPARDAARPYAIRPFGTGAMAVLWAHLAALAKRPVANVAAPFAVGLAISIGAMVWFPRVAHVVPLAIGSYALLLLALSGGRTLFASAVQQRSLTRPLPIAPWRLVIADVAVAAIPGTAAAWGAGLPLLGGGPLDRITGALLLACTPPVLVCVLLACYTVAFWYPDRTDKAAGCLSGLVSGLGMLVLFTWLMLLITPFVTMGAPYALFLSVPIGCAVACAVLVPLAAGAFVRCDG